MVHYGLKNENRQGRPSRKMKRAGLITENPPGACGAEISSPVDSHTLLLAGSLLDEMPARTAKSQNYKC